MEAERQSQKESQQIVESSDTTAKEKYKESGKATLSSLANTGEDRFIIYYDGLFADPQEKILEELDKWIQERDPSNHRTVHIIQEVIVDNLSASDRRNTAFKRYYVLSGYIKNTIGNKNAIKSFSVIKGDAQQNRAIVFFKD